MLRLQTLCNNAGDFKGEHASFGIDISVNTIVIVCHDTYNYIRSDSAVNIVVSLYKVSYSTYLHSYECSYTVNCIT